MQIFDYPITTGLIAINIVVFALIHLNVLSVGNLGSSYLLTIQNRQYYRIVSSAFTQREIMHLLCNMYSLYNVGSVLERFLTAPNYAIIYVVIMVAGGVISALIHKKGSPFTLSIGASGVICGLIGVYAVIAFYILGFNGIRSVIPTIVLLVAMTGSKRIDSIGHFTGLLVGIVCGITFVMMH